MDLKKVLRFGVILSIFVIIGYFYYSFFYKNKNIISKSNDVLVTNNSNHADEIVSELQNIEYNSTDKNGNSYYLNAERAFINLEDKKDDKINLEKVVAIINIKKKVLLILFQQKLITTKLTMTLYSTMVLKLSI